MPKYEYKGEVERSFPTLGITVKNGDVFDGPEGLTALGLSLAEPAKSAPAATAKKTEVPFNANAKDGDKDGFVQDGTIHERPIGKSETKPSASSDTNAGA